MKTTITLPDQETILSRLRNIEVPNYTGLLKLDKLYQMIAQEGGKELDESGLIAMLLEKAVDFVFAYYQETGNSRVTLEMFKLIYSYLTIYIHVLIDDRVFAQRASIELIT